MALDKLVDSNQLDGALGFTADAIREKTGEVLDLTWDMDTGFSDAIGAIVTLAEGSSDADATAADIRSGKIAYVDGEQVAGSLENGTITNNTTLASGASSSGTVNQGSYIKIGAGVYDNDVYYQGQANSGTLDIDTTDDVGTISVDGYANVNVTGINLPKPQSGTNSFSIKLPNGSGNDTITFTFVVDSSGNVAVTES